jgi:hypothetical protein
LLIDLRQVTAQTELGVTGDIACNFGPLKNSCFCALCSGDTTMPCNSNAECEAAGAGECNSFGGDRAPLVNNSCSLGTNEACVAVDEGGLFGECMTGPDDRFCDAIVKASGAGFFGCTRDADCAESSVGVPAGFCTLVQRRECFLDPIIAIGEPDPQFPIGAATFCIGKVASSPAINTVAGLPGPARIINQAKSTLFCKSDPSVQYMPGVGGCP